MTEQTLKLNFNNTNNLGNSQQYELSQGDNGRTDDLVEWTALGCLNCKIAKKIIWYVIGKYANFCLRPHILDTLLEMSRIHPLFPIICLND